MEQPEKSEPDGFLKKIRNKETQKMRARRLSRSGLWYGFAMTGKVGWAIVVPTLLGVLLGYWLDEHWPQSFSWKLSLLFVGLFIGCLNAWFWLQREKKNMQNENEDE